MTTSIRVDSGSLRWFSGASENSANMAVNLWLKARGWLSSRILFEDSKWQICFSISRHCLLENVNIELIYVLSRATDAQDSKID